VCNGGLFVQFGRTEEIVEDRMPKLSLLAALAFVAVGCGVDLPATAPTATPAHGTPSKIELSASSGIGPNGGKATVTAASSTPMRCCCRTCR